MSDIRLTWHVYAGDIAIALGDLVMDDGLETAVILSLFTDRRAHDNDVLPDGQTDPRGWWGDAFADVEGDRTGSRLWLIAREKQQATVLARAKEYAEEALRWLLDDQIAESVSVLASIPQPGWLGLEVTIQQPSADLVQFKFTATWAAQAARAEAA